MIVDFHGAIPEGKWHVNYLFSIINSLFDKSYHYLQKINHNNQMINDKQLQTIVIWCL